MLVEKYLNFNAQGGVPAAEESTPKRHGGLSNIFVKALSVIYLVLQDAANKIKIRWMDRPICLIVSNPEAIPLPLPLVILLQPVRRDEVAGQRLAVEGQRT